MIVRILFQSTLPARGATGVIDVRPGLIAPISIHAPREGSDTIKWALMDVQDAFQSTLPARGATSSLNPAPSLPFNFNPRSPRGERRNTTGLSLVGFSHFNPRSPRGERLAAIAVAQITTAFQSTLPARGATAGQQRRHPYRAISIHAPREGSDRDSYRPYYCGAYFNPRSPRGERPVCALF